jgi:hypothetical protein
VHDPADRAPSSLPGNHRHGRKAGMQHDRHRLPRRSRSFRDGARQREVKVLTHTPSR